MKRLDFRRRDLSLSICLKRSLLATALMASCTVPSTPTFFEDEHHPPFQPVVQQQSLYFSVIITKLSQLYVGAQDFCPLRLFPPPFTRWPTLTSSPRRPLGKRRKGFLNLCLLSHTPPLFKQLPSTPKNSPTRSQHDNSSEWLSAAVLVPDCLWHRV